MTCPHCQKEIEGTPSDCPQCGGKIDARSGVFQTSTVLISIDGTDHVYRSVDEVPAPLRSRLLKTTNSTNSATILIADRKGRKEIDKALRKPGPAQRRLGHSILSGEPAADPLAWLTPARRKWIAVILFVLALTVTLTVFLYHGKI